MKKSWHSLQFQLTISLVGLMVFISGSIIAFQFFRYRYDLDQDLRKNLLAQVSLAAMSIDGDAHEKLNSQTDRESPEYLKVITPMQEAAKINPDLGGVYTVEINKQGAWVFVADIDPEPLDIDTPIEDLSQILIDNPNGFTEPAVESEYYTDEWGTWLTGYAPIHNTTGDIVAYLAMDIARSTVDEKEQQLILISSMIFLISIPVTILVGWLLSRWIISAIQKVNHLIKTLAETDLPNLAAACDQLADGNLDQHIVITSEQINIQSKTELGDMAKSLNDMIGHLQAVGKAFNSMSLTFSRVFQEFGEQTERLNKAASRMEEMSKSIGNQVSQIQNAVDTVGDGSHRQNDSVTGTHDLLNSISDTVASVEQGAREQAHAVSVTDGVMQEFSNLIETVVEGSSRQAETARRSTESVQKSAATVETAVKNLRNIQLIVDQSTIKMNEMGEQTRQISSILETITEIASQTNMLSLNAAIEAARAGEHGRGFSIVADEVGKLAEKSSDAAREISTLIGGIQKAADEALKAMESSQSEVESGVLMGEKAGEALAEILELVKESQNSGEQISEEANKMVGYSDNLTDSLKQVSDLAGNYQRAVDQMSAHIESIQGTMNQVNEISFENTQSMDAVASDVNTINLGMDELSTSSTELSALSDTLQQTLSRFHLANN